MELRQAKEKAYEKLEIKITPELREKFIDIKDVNTKAKTFTEAYHISDELLREYIELPAKIKAALFLEGSPIAVFDFIKNISMELLEPLVIIIEKTEEVEIEYLFDLLEVIRNTNEESRVKYLTTLIILLEVLNADTISGE